MFAVDSAVESSQPLTVATPEVSGSVRRPAELARSLGVAVERLRIRSPRSIKALLERSTLFGRERTASCGVSPDTA